MIHSTNNNSEQKKATSSLEKALLASEIRYRRLFESAKDGILILDAETGMIIDVNPFLVNLLGYQKENFTQKAVWEIGFFKDIIQNKKKFLELQQNEYVRYEDLPLETANGRKIHVEFVSNTYLADSNKVIQCIIRDITEHWQMEKKIIDSEDKFRSIIENSADAIFIANKEGKYVYVNKQATNLLGYSEEELLSSTIADISPANRLEEYYNIFQRLFKEGSSYSEIELVKKDGIHFPADLNAVLLPNGLLYGSCRDMTMRKHAEEEVRESEEKFRMIFENAFDGISIYRDDPDSYKRRLVECNEQYANMAGRSRYELLQLGKMKELQIADEDKLNQNRLDSIKSGKEYYGSYSWIRPDGKENVIEYVGKPVTWKGNSYTIGIDRDVTEHKRIEKELIKAKEKAETAEIQLLSILENSSTGFAINTISTGKTRYVNKAFSNIYLIPHELCQNLESFFEYVYVDQMELGNQILDDVKSGDPKRMKWNMIPVTNKTTKKIHFVSAANIILKDQDLMISSVWDITSQVENEKKLIEALNKATESDRLKSAFLANMSHEIRTPMNGILGFTELLKEPKLSGKKQQEFIDIIEKSGARMLNIINDIINIARIESEQIELSVSDVNINELARDIFDFFQPEAAKKELNFSCKNILSSSEANIKTDKGKVSAVLTNLIKNALKFTQTGSIELGYERKGAFIEFFIKDTGSGVIPKQKKFIFERFRQGNESITRNYEGAGLGLAISKAYVEMLGGKIWIESKVGQGSIFRFSIPYINGAKVNERLSAITEKEILHQKNLKIMVVEDDETSRMLLRITIKSLNCDIFQATTGLEAIEICRNNPDINLVLMDINMPGMNGYEATRQIRKFNKEIIIIAQTAYALSGDREKVIEAGCNDYISKPIKKATLLKIIEKNLRSLNV